MAGLHFDITGDNKNLLRNLEGSKQGIKSLTHTAETESASIDSIMSRIGQSAAKIGIGFSATKLVSDVVRVRGEIEQLQKSFDVLAGAKGGELFEQIKEFAVSTPMDMPELAKGAQTLMAFNTEAEEVMPILRAIGDISMGNKEKFQSLTLAFSQMSSSGKLMGQDLMQMINAGFNPLSVISEQTGKSIGELKEEMSKGAISADMIKKAFMDATSEGGKFNGMLESMSSSVTGQISNLKGAFEDMLNEIGQESQGMITGAISAASSLVENYEKVLDIIGQILVAYGSYKAVLAATAAFEGAATSAKYSIEIAELQAILPLKQQSANADIQQAVASGQMTEAEAEKVIALRAEVQAYVDKLNAAKAAAAHDAAEALRKKRENLEEIDSVTKQIGILREKGEHKKADALQTRLQTLEINKATLATEAETAVEIANKAAKDADTVSTKVNTLSQNENTKSTTLLAAAKAKLAAISKSALATLTNPYVIAAAAVAALSVGIYKLVTAKSAEEKAIDRVNKKREESDKKREEEKNKIDGLLNIINDDTQTRTAQVRAYNELTKVMPEFTKELSLEALQAMSAAEQAKKLNEAHEALDISNAKAQITEYTRLMNELEASEGDYTKISSESANAIRDIMGPKWNGSIKEAIKFLKESIKDAEKTIKDFEDANPDIEVQIKAAENIQKQAQDAYEKALKAYEDAKAKYQDRFGQSVENWDDVLPPWVIARLREAEELLSEANKNVDTLKSSQTSDSESQPKNKKYWEDKKKAAENEIAKLDVSEIGGAKWKQYEAEIKEANRMLERYSGKYLEDAKKRDEELLELKRQTAEELAGINKSELDRELADVQESYAKRMEELAKLEEKWKAAQGGRLTDEQSSALSSGRNAANDVRNKGVSDAVNAQIERYKQEKDEEKKHLEDLLEEFETYEQARERIAKEYAEKRKQMVNEDGSLKAGFTQGNLDNVNAQQQEAEEALDQAMLEKSESYQTWLESIEEMTLDSLRKALVQAKFALEMAKMRGDSKGTATAKAQIDVLSKQIKNMETSPKKRSLEDWRNLSEAISEAGDSFEGLSEELEAMGGDVSKVAGAILKSVGSIGSSTIGLINNITQLTQMSIKGTNETAETSSKAVQSVEKASVILAIISAAVQIITKIINLANQMHDAKYDKVIEDNQAKIDSLKKSYEGLQEQLDETFGKGAVQTLQEMNVSLEQQNKLIEEQKDAEQEKKKEDESSMQGYDDALEANRKQMEENTKAMEEAIFGDDIKSAIESFAEAYGDAIAEGKDLNQSMKDHAVQMMKQMVQEEIKAYIAGQGKLEALREKMALYFEDGVFSDSEIAAIKAEAEAIGKDLDKKFAWAEELLSDEEDSSSSSSSSKRGIATASQESVDENNGRLMSIQLSMGEIKEQMVYTVTYLASMTSSISSGNHILSDIREQAVRANGLLEDIVKYTKPLNDKVGEVVSAINKINSK